ncbi:hypothetical protein FKM82_017876 [Ascaphus truei]
MLHSFYRKVDYTGYSAIYGIFSRAVDIDSQGCSKYFSSFFCSASDEGLELGQDGVLQALHSMINKIRISSAMTQLKEMATTAPVDSPEPISGGSCPDRRQVL